MNISTVSFKLKTDGNTDIINITGQVENELQKSGFTEGSATVFVAGSTAGITTIEFEPGLRKDYPQFFERIIPSNATYHHDQTWHDGNGHSHIRASLQGASFTVPFVKGNLLLGTWQQIILVDFDNRARQREVIVQFIGKMKNEN